MENLTVSHKTFGKGQIESIEKKVKLEHTYINVHFEKDNSTRRFLIFDNVGKPIPFLKFFEKSEEVLSFFEDYKDFLFNQLKKSFPQYMVHETPVVVEEEDDKKNSKESKNILKDNKEYNKVLKENNTEDIVKEEILNISTEEIKNEKPEVPVQTITNVDIPKETVEETPVKKGRGRPKGSTNKKIVVDTPVKKGRGRPKGSVKKK